MTPKEKMVARIRALLSKTVENGATEAEAMSALAKAQEIMFAHGLDLEAIEAETFVRETYATKAAQRGFYWGKEIAYGVSQFTGAFCWCDTKTGNVVYAGRESDAIFAYWLTDALDGFITRNAAAYVNQYGGARTNGSQPRRLPGQRDMFRGDTPVRYNPETNSSRNTRIRDFALGVCARVVERLLEMATDETKQRCKDARRHVESEGMSFSKSRSHGPSVGNRDAYIAGQAAGNSATFSRPVNGGAGMRMIA